LEQLQAVAGRKPDDSLAVDDDVEDGRAKFAAVAKRPVAVSGEGNGGEEKGEEERERTPAHSRIIVASRASSWWSGGRFGRRPPARIRRLRAAAAPQIHLPPAWFHFQPACLRLRRACFRLQPARSRLQRACFHLQPADPHARTGDPRAQTADSERATYAVLLLYCRAGSWAPPSGVPLHRAALITIGPMRDTRTSAAARPRRVAPPR